jgi:hypothetical protein
MEFHTELFLPILKKNVKIKSIKNILYFEILKFLKTNNNDVILDCFEQLLKEILVDSSIINNITNYEKFLILLEARIISLGDKIVTTTDNFDGNISIVLSYTKNYLIDKINQYELIQYFGDDNCKIKLNLPKKFLLKDIDDIYKYVIDEVIINDEKYVLNHLTEEEVDMVITNLPAKFATDILNYIRYITKISEEVAIISENEKTGMKRVAFGLIDNTLFYFIKNIFTEDLNNYYELMYSMIKKLNLDYNNFMQITPNECKMLINFYNADMKREEDAQKGISAPKMPTMPSMPKVPKFG